MSVDLPHALAAVLSTAERDHLGYVLYRDPHAERRIVVFVEGASDEAAFRVMLRRPSAEDGDSAGGSDLIVRAAATDDAPEREYVIELKASSGKSGIANLLWLAATDAGAAAARKSVELDS
jgi:hypothetical protein